MPYFRLQIPVSEEFSDVKKANSDVPKTPGPLPVWVDGSAHQRITHPLLHQATIIAQFEFLCNWLNAAQRIYGSFRIYSLEMRDTFKPWSRGCPYTTSSGNAENFLAQYISTYNLNKAN